MEMKDEMMGAHHCGCHPMGGAEQPLSMPRIGDAAPQFKALSTQGKITFPTDYAGKWIILFSHPADFTPVCTSEFITFASMKQDFEALNCQLVGLSIDSLSSHIAWLHAIYEEITYKEMSKIKVEFPLIADITMEVAKQYGMLQPNASETAAVRAVFFIDPKGVIRTIIYYPLQLGRNFKEIKRVLIGLQTIDAFQVALPADWHPGEEVVIHAPTRLDAAIERTEQPSEETTCYDWFFCTRPLPHEEIREKLKRK